MALPRSLSAWLLLSMIAFYLVDSSSSMDDHYVMTSNGRSLLGPTPSQSIMNCGSACGVRCSRAWKTKMCLKLCNICCGKCSCVPPGTSAETRAQCPCYANMRAPNGKFKCP